MEQAMHIKVHPKSALVLMHGKKSRTISSKIIQGHITLPPMSAEEADEWSKQIAPLGFVGKGEVANLGPNTRLVTPEGQKAVKQWLAGQGIVHTVSKNPASPLVCTGAQFHHDAEAYPTEVFCVVWLSDDTPWDLYFPYLDIRIPLKYGTTVLFDSAQPHGVVAHGETGFYEDDIEFGTGVFISQDLFVSPEVRKVMDIALCSRKGKRGFIQLNNEGYREELDPNTAAWSIVDTRRRSPSASTAAMK